MSDVLILGGARTPMTDYTGALKDISALELGAMALARCYRLGRYLERHGETYRAKTAAGSVMFRKRPEAQLYATSWRDALAALTKLGMTPSDASRVGLDPTVIPWQAGDPAATPAKGDALPVEEGGVDPENPFSEFLGGPGTPPAGSGGAA